MLQTPLSKSGPAFRRARMAGPVSAAGSASSPRRKRKYKSEHWKSVDGFPS